MNPTVNSRIIKRSTPLIVLLLLPAGINEFLVRATPLSAIPSNPLVIPFVLGFYGAGVLSLRKLCLRWKKGMWSLGLLGAAFGIILEGLVTGTFFSTANAQVGFLATYGNWLGVNWVWAVHVTLGNALFTVVLSVLLVNLLYPEWRSVPLLSRRQLAVTLTTFAAFPVVANLASPSHPSIFLLAGTLTIVAGLSLLAWKLPSNLFVPLADNPRSGSGVFFIVGFAFNASLFVISSGVTPTPLPAIITVWLLITSCAVMLTFVLLRTGRSANEHVQLAFTSGLLSFFFVTDAVRVVTGNFEILLVTGAFVVLLLIIRRRVNRR